MPVNLMGQVSKTILILLAFVTLSGCGPSFKSEDIFSTEQRDNASFSVKIIAFRERRSFAQVLGGAYYVFETKNRQDRDWRRFLVVKHDDLEPIDKNSIVLVDEHLGYVFMLRNFAVTNDGGVTWSVWHVSKIQPLRDDLSCRIQKVNVMSNGTGTMDVKCNKSSTVLSTKDFGVSWQE